MPYADRETRLAYLREYRTRNPDARKYVDRVVGNQSIKERNRNHVRHIKEANPCVDCGLHFEFYCMDFDHVRGVKHRNISNLVEQNASIATIDAEIAKCDLVCAICHRRRTYKRGQMSEREEFSAADNIAAAAAVVAAATPIVQAVLEKKASKSNKDKADGA